MPYFDTLEDDEKNGDQTDPPQLSTSPIGAATNPISNAQKAQTTAKKGSGNFADLNEYLRVNQPQQFGTQLAGKVGDDVTKAGEAVAGAGSEFKNRADQATIAANPDLVKNAVDDPTKFVADQNNVDAFGKQFNATYGGPAAYTDAADLYNTSSGAAKTASGKSQAATTEGGRFALLDNYYGRNNYNQGQKSLDNLLVQNDPNARQAFDQVAENAKALQAQEQTQEKDLSAYGSNAKATTEATRAAARGALGVDDAGNLTDASPINKITADEKARADAANTAADTEYNNLLSKLKSQDITWQDLVKLGLPQYVNNYGVDPSEYLSENNNKATAQTIATKDELARIKALSQLSGVDNTFLPDDSTVGTYDPTKNVSYDSDRFLSNVAAAKAGYENVLNTPVNLGKQPGMPVAYDANGNSSGATYKNIYEAQKALIAQIAKVHQAYDGNDPRGEGQAEVDSLNQKIRELQQQIDVVNTQYGIGKSALGLGTNK